MSVSKKPMVMTDIVERLYVNSRRTSYRPDIDPLILEAASEIERLREELAVRKEPPAPQRVKPLSYDERTAGSVYVESIGLNDWFKRIMAARGIEVGE